MSKKSGRHVEYVLRDLSKLQRRIDSIFKLAVVDRLTLKEVRKRLFVGVITSDLWSKLPRWAYAHLNAYMEAKGDMLASFTVTPRAA